MRISFFSRPNGWLCQRDGFPNEQRDWVKICGGIVVFIISFAAYLKTIAPTVPFWDCGEFIACAYTLAVPHPPGSPLFTLIGRLFSLIPISETISFRVNFISVLSSAFTILLLYLIIIQLITSFRGKPKGGFQQAVVFGGAMLGALSYAFTDTFWFNAVEAEVYALSMLFTSLTLWLALRWFEYQKELSSVKYLLLVCYFFGLAYGVHLLNLLLVPTVMLFVLFSRFESIYQWQLWAMAILSALLFTIVSALAAGGGFAHIGGIILISCILTCMAGALLGVFWGVTKHKWDWLAGGIIAFGISIVIISTSLNFIKTTFGETVGGWKLPIVIGIGNLVLIYLVFFAAAFTAGLILIRYNQSIASHSKSLLTGMLIIVLSIFVIILIGRSTYFSIYIRSGMDTTINENAPSNVNNFLYYINREQYGPASSLSSLLDRQGPLWDYQIKFLYLRYFGWNFIGKGLTLDEDGFVQENFSLHGLNGLPFLIGIIGLLYHFVKDWRKALSLLIFFLLSGVILVIYLNQAPKQPRERDYFYIGSFFAYAIWIGIGAAGILELMNKWFADMRLKTLGISIAFASLFIISPFSQFMNNYYTHNRTGDYIPWDYSYDLLMTCEKDALLFTNGDNDTFPVWYLQEVEGIRKDVRIINLSLLNTNWYIKQLKYYKPTVQISISDADIDKLDFARWDSSTVQMQVPRPTLEQFYAEYGQKPTEAQLNTKAIDVPVYPRITYNNQTYLQAQDIMILHIIAQNNWKRPVYFAITIPIEYLLGFKDYARLDGLAWKITPIKNPPISANILQKNIIEKYKYRELNNKSVYLDFNSTRLLYNFRSGFIRLANDYLSEGQNDKAAGIIDSMLVRVPEFRSLGDWELIESIGKLYFLAGRKDELKKRILMLADLKYLPTSKKVEYAQYLYTYFKDTSNTEKLYKSALEGNPNDNIAVGELVTLYEETKQYAKAIEPLEQWLKRHPNDSLAQKKLTDLKDSIGKK